MTVTIVLFTLLVSATLVVASGTMLARAADVIAAETRLGGVWIGASLLALATSLPEITTDISAVRMGALDLAAGDLFGSSMANMLILAIITLVPAGNHLFRNAALDHALYATLAITLTCIAAIAILVHSPVTVLGMGPGSILLLVTYLVGARAIFRHSAIARAAASTIEMSQGPAGAADGDQVSASQSPMGRSLPRAILMFVGAAVVILIAAPPFARAAATLADLTGLGTTFVGTWLVGITTSLPELVTSFAAIRLRAYDLAVGNLFGSNALNMTIFVALDLVHQDGPLLGLISPAHVISALVGVVLMSTATAALIFRTKGALIRLEPTSGLIVVGYLMGLVLLYFQHPAR